MLNLKGFIIYTDNRDTTFFSSKLRAEEEFRKEQKRGDAHREKKRLATRVHGMRIAYLTDTRKYIDGCDIVKIAYYENYSKLNQIL